MSTQDAVLAAARNGDEHAFGQLVAPYRRELHAHAYRMLGSAADADDALQDAMLGAWRGLARFEQRSSLRSWLYTITTNASLKTIRRRPKRVLPVDLGPSADPMLDHAAPLAETTWIQPVPDDDVLAPEARYEQRESVELAFIAALQHLPARQRAVLILRDVLGFTARESAEVLETTPASIDSALQRAHKTVDERLPDASQQRTLRSIDDDALHATVDGYMRAMESADVPAIAAMLSDDVALAMPPVPEWYSGRDAVATYLEEVRLGDWARRFLPTRANAQPAGAHYVWDMAQQAFVPHAIHVLALGDGARIREITLFCFPELFARFGLPERIEAG